MYLIFVKFTIFIFLLPLGLKGDDHKTYEYVHHKERNDDDIDKEEDGYSWSMVVDGSLVLFMRVNWFVQKTESKDDSVIKCKI